MPVLHRLSTVALVGLVSILLISGFVHADFGVDARVAPPASNSDVPRAIPRGGPIIGTVNGSAESYRVPHKTAILSFDDGPDPTWTPKILKVLRKHDVPATFFVVGSRVARHPEIVRDMRETGAEIGIHTFTHPDLSYSPEWREQMELSETQVSLAGAAGVTSALLRPPYSSQPGAIDDNTWPVIEEAGQHGYVTVLTTLDAKDWRKPGVDQIVRNGTPKGGSGEILLLHDAGGDRSQTVAALKRLIPQLRDQGYTFSTVGQVLHRGTTNPEATPWEHVRGVALITVVGVANVIANGLAYLLLLVGLLVVARLVLMIVVARRHVRQRRSRHWSWGQPVTEPASVIVPAYNERECIADTVRSLAASDHPVEVIVVDDGSTDGTADIVDELRLGNVMVIRKPNGGKPSALNTGIAHAAHDLIVTVDGDTVFQPDTVRRLVQPFADLRVGAVSGNTKVANRKKLVGRWQHIEYVVGFNVDRRVYDILHCMPTVPGPVGAFRRAALIRVDGVSDDTLAEDTDLTMALCRAGWRVVYEESAYARTETPATLSQLWRQRYRWSYGTIKSMWKHRKAVFERGPSGRFGRFGLLNLGLFQVLLPLLSPLVDILLLYGLLFLDPLNTAFAWLAIMSVQLLAGAYAFWLDREPLRRLWLLPVQQIVYRQLMYTVLIQSVVAALCGVRLGWHKLERSGGLSELLSTGNRDRLPEPATPRRS